MVGLFVLLSSFASIWTERMWFKSVSYGSVFSTLLWTRVGLFLVFGALMAATVAVCIIVAHRTRPLLWPGLPGTAEDGLDRYRDAVTPIMGWLVTGISLLMGAFAGASATGQWRSYMLWRNGGSFGVDDPYFEKDAGFYAFDLPWWHFVVDFAMALAVVGLMATIVVHYLFGGIRLAARPGQRLTGAAQVQISVLLGVFVLVKAVDYWLDRYDLVHGGGGIFTGMGYTDDKAVLPAKEILTGIAVICALLFFANIWRRTWMLPSLGVALFAVSAVILGMIVPGVVQQFQVSPNVPDKEGPYLAKNIEATRAAYGLDQIEEQEFSGTEIGADGRLDALDGMTASVPLVDPKVVSQTFELQQQVRPYYSVGDVLDVDRYELGGKDRAVVLAVRELDQSGIAEDNRTWANLHTVYTHGEGIIAAYANQRPEADDRQSSNVQWAEGQEPDQDALTTMSDEGYETRVYFGEKSPQYSIVGGRDGAEPIELDLPESDESDEEESNEASTYSGLGGVPIDGIFDKTLFALKFSEPNMLLSTRVHDNSRILFDREPRTMVEKVAPWLTVDSDPYPAVIDGRIQWILDGYTVTDKYPMSQRESLESMTDDALQDNVGFQTLPTDEVNYLRNAVKATVDAYDGTVTLYAWDESDPILRAWQGAFPGVVKPKADIPDSLMSHLRYPEDLFKAQRYQYQRYHITDAQAWLEGSERWEAPKDPQAKDRLQAPYRLFTDADADDEQTWSLTSVYVWPKRDKLAAFMEVNSDATSNEYGKISVLELPNEATDGPRLIANTLSTNDEVRDRLLPYTQGDAKAVYGNLLTLPVGDDFMYVQPLYTVRDSESAFPVLSFVLVSYRGEVGIGSTLRGAIADSLQVANTAPEPSGGEGTGDGTGSEEEPEETDGGEQPTAGTQARIRELLREADEKFTQADEAQRSGNTVRWARLMEQARALIDEAVTLSSR
jgi:uncharacterized membrane protein (UPF0182 family)